MHTVPRVCGHTVKLLGTGCRRNAGVEAFECIGTEAQAIARKRADYQRYLLREAAIDAIWLELLPSRKNRCTHFIRCTIDGGAIFKGAFVLHGDVDRACELLCSAIGRDWWAYQNATTEAVKHWCLLAFVDAWVKSN